MIRIVHVIRDLARAHGGPTVACLGMCSALARRGHAVTLITTDGDLADPPIVANGQPVPLHNFDVRCFPVVGARYWGYSSALWQAADHIVREADIVHIHSLYLFHTSVIAAACRRRGVPYVLRPHGTLDPFLRRRRRIRKWIYMALLERRNLNGAAAMHYTSEMERDLAHEPLGLRSRPVVIPLGVEPPGAADPSAVEQLLRQQPQLAGKTIALFLGRLNFKKGLELLAPAFAQVYRRNPNLHLLVVGPEDAVTANQFKSAVRELDIDAGVTILGPVRGREKEAVFAASDFFVLPSHTENFAVAMFEAMARGLPVIVSDQVNTASEVIAANAGLVVPCDADALAAAMLTMTEDPARREQMGDAGRRLVSNNYTWDHTANQLERLYADLASNRHEFT